MKLSEYLDVNLLAEHINNRLINVQHHHYAPLAVYNYGPKCQFDGLWDDVTCKCRGLIVDQSTDEIIARPFQKFFNLGTADRPETMEENFPTTTPEITEKLDGSLGILYRIGNQQFIATRGSFASDQAAWASAWYAKNICRDLDTEGWTYLFEIIYPDNRIVVKYDWEGLALLAAINNETGEEMQRSNLEAAATLLECRIVPQVPYSIAECRTANKENEEGYVFTWHKDGQPPLKLKVKFIDYVRLHRLLTQISPKRIWEMLRDHESFDELFDHTPSHYQEWVNYWKNGLQAEYGRYEQKAKIVWESYQQPKDGQDKAQRKAFAEFVTLADRKDVAGILFQMLDGKSYEENIWKLCRNKVRDQEPFRREE